MCKIVLKLEDLGLLGANGGLLMVLFFYSFIGLFELLLQQCYLNIKLFIKINLCQFSTETILFYHLIIIIIICGLTCI